MRVGLIALGVLFCPSVAQAEDQTLCLEQLAGNLPVDSQLTVATIHARIFAGRLHALDLSSGSLTIQDTNSLDSQLRTFQGSELALIRYRQPGHFKAGYAFLGLTLGSAAGFGVGAAVTSGGGTSDEIEDAIGQLALATAGGIVGLVIGILVPMHDRWPTIECR